MIHLWKAADLKYGTTYNTGSKFEDPSAPLFCVRSSHISSPFGDSRRGRRGRRDGIDGRGGKGGRGGRDGRADRSGRGGMAAEGAETAEAAEMVDLFIF